MCRQLSDTECTALRNYIDKAAVNKDLRKGINNPDVNILDSLFENAKKELTVYRGMKRQDFELINGVYRDPAYLSCTSDQDIAIQKFCGYEGNKYGVLMIVSLPIGTPIINFTKYGFGQEEEIILFRDLSLILTETKEYLKKPKRAEDSLCYYASQNDLSPIEFLDSLVVYKFKLQVID